MSKTMHIEDEIEDGIARSIPPGVLLWNGGVVVHLAREAERRLREGLHRTDVQQYCLVLADALEEAGCDDATGILSHLRQEGHGGSPYCFVVAGVLRAAVLRELS